MKTRTKDWLANHVGCKLKFKCGNSPEFEEVLDYKKSYGIFVFPFYGGEANADICLIADHENDIKPIN